MGRNNKGHQHRHGEKFEGRQEVRKEFIKKHPEFPALRQQFQKDKEKLKVDHSEYLKLNKKLKGEQDIEKFLKDHSEFSGLRKKFFDAREKLDETHSKFLKLREDFIVKKDIEKFTQDNPKLVKEMEEFDKLTRKKIENLEKTFMKDNPEFTKWMKEYNKLKEEFQKEFIKDNPKFAEKMQELSKLKQAETAKLGKEFIHDHPESVEKVQKFSEHVEQHKQEGMSRFKFWKNWKNNENWKNHKEQSQEDRSKTGDKISEKLVDKANFQIENPLKLLVGLIDHTSNFHHHDDHMDPMRQVVTLKGKDSFASKDVGALTFNKPH